MRPVPQPTDDVATVASLCVKSVRDIGLKKRLQTLSPQLSTMEADYQREAAQWNLFAIPESKNWQGCASPNEMRALYENTFVKSTRTRSIYEKLKLAAPGGICPLCNQRTVSTLDHHLSKSTHPALAITPLNLVPSCKDCNSDTLVRQASVAGELTIHPYFHAVDDEVWLFGRVIETTPPTISFFAQPPSTWSKIKSDIVKSHFKTFGLSTLYTTHAAVELNNIYYDISTVFSAGAAAALKSYCANMADNRRHVMRNSWQASVYQALHDSDWFLQGGFRSIVTRLPAGNLR